MDLIDLPDNVRNIHPDHLVSELVLSDLKLELDYMSETPTLHTTFCLLFPVSLEIYKNLSILLGQCSALVKTVFYHGKASWPLFSGKRTNTGTCREFELCIFALWLTHGPGMFCLLSHHAAQLGHDKGTERSFPEPRNRSHIAFS